MAVKVPDHGAINPNEEETKMTNNQYMPGGYVPYIEGDSVETLAAWGRLPEAREGDGEREWIAPGMPPWEPETEGRPGWVVPVVLMTLALAVLVLTGFIVQRADVLPQRVPLIGKDTGVAACEAIAEQGNLRGVAEVKGAGQGATMTEPEYRKIRDIFADSRYPDIRDNGTTMADYAWQLQGMTKDADNALAALPLIAPMTAAYTGLAGGCADHGHTIPALGS